MKKSILFTISILLSIHFSASAQKDFRIKNEQVIVSDLKTSALINAQSIVCNGEEAVVIITRIKELSLLKITNNKKVGKEKILEIDNKMSEIEQVLFNPHNYKAYMVLKRVYTFKIEYYLQQVDVFNAKLVGDKIELGEFKMPNYQASLAYRLSIRFGDNGEVQMRTLTSNGKKSFPSFNITSYTENLKPIGTFRVSFEKLESKYKSLKVVSESFKHNQFYFILSVVPEADAGLGKLERGVLHVTDIDGKQIIHKMFGGLKEKEEHNSKQAKLIFNDNNLYISGYYIVRNGSGNSYSDLDYFFYLAKYNTTNNEFVYEEKINVKKLITEQEVKLFHTESLKKFPLAELEAPFIFLISDGLILIAQTFNGYESSNTQYRRSDLLIKVNNNGKVVKSAIIKKSTESNFINQFSNDYGNYVYGEPLYYQYENGNIIQFYITNPSDPKPEKLGAVKFKNLNSSKAKSHYVVISPDLKVSNPVDVQIGPTNSTDAPFISEYQSCIMKSPDGKGNIIVNFVKDGSKLHVGFTTIEN